ncbi:hypothetical protein BKA58DRAFT_375688 [Alternaria rosae]|uniref:uncharacterized protein n=1 Tax=Alternaria rosae TaxID=1187941 RepID=UPI001E8E3AB9|nr:uncharacterized protein BKA58DRAFT_375688 [Alternaria rosae]KAH6877669.1 hypothetical protein BKA58DRAFT_375688 [Alternaria rosae]
MAIPRIQGAKRVGGPQIAGDQYAPDTTSAPEQAVKRAKKHPFDTLALGKMGYDFEIPAVIARVRSKAAQPFDVGMGLGVMLYHIVPLISSHLENPMEFHNKAPKALQWATDFVEAIDQYIAYLRLTDGCSEKFPNDATVDRKSRRPRRKYMERCTHLVENAYRDHVREQLCDMFRSWSKEQTQLFNKGVDKALSGIQWVVYPEENVVLAAGDDEWAVWLRGRCEELGMLEARAQRKVFEEI